MELTRKEEREGGWPMARLVNPTWQNNVNSLFQK
jgi:hypothetical protein